MSKHNKILRKILKFCTPKELSSNYFNEKSTSFRDASGNMLHNTSDCGDKIFSPYTIPFINRMYGISFVSVMFQ